MFGNNYEKPQVKCEVENCVYNKSKSCYASSIKVDSCCDSQVRECCNTECATFKQNDSCCM
ncbi:MAG: DUF1540 domain-containing protein [Oscillospiraceae bacterium]|jgi:hypothetical protein